MKNIWKYILIGCLVAIGGRFAATLGANLFNSAWIDGALIGIGMYLCFVVVVCTGVLICKIDNAQNLDQKKNDEMNN